MPSSDGPRLLEARGLRRAYGRRTVLRDIDLTLSAGEAVAVAGPNGAGKTTLLRVLAGLARPDRGEVRLDGQPLRRDAPEVRRAVGLVSHQTLLYDDLTLHENLTFAARLYGLPTPAAAARSALDEAGLGARADESPRRLSRGLAQRAAIARALLHRPRVLLLDEPFTALDAAASERLRDELRARREQGLGIVLVTHQLGEAWAVATRIAVIVEGRWACDETLAGSLEG
ncbi:MAG TPA: heme ABC exporter ATP-binding protein CcmA, partial [Gemmatimonadales bacterium]|nr:heme ABC exporter ATP-binding protein CcmA [Gemmatimonadales bacterium]